MNTKEWGVLSFLVGISMAGLYQEVPSTMFVLVVVPVFCTIIGYSAWRSSTSLSHTIQRKPSIREASRLRYEAFKEVSELLSPYHRGPNI